jgi:winged helix DNA-binding protein
MRALTWDQVYARRLERSSLDERAPRERLLDVLRATCGAHAQLMTGAELAMSARVDGVTRDDVRDLLLRRELVKGATLRSTLHVHPADDFALWKSTFSRWREQMWLDWQGLTLAEAEDLRERVLAVLDEPLTRTEIGAAVGGRFGKTIAEDSWGHYLAPASDLLCQGPPRGRNVTFVRCDKWIAGWKPGAGRLEAARRYLETYAPVRRDEFEHWLARKLPEWDELDLEEVDVEGCRTFVPRGQQFPEAEPHGVRLLWHYDVYVIACHPRDHLIPREKQRVFLRGAGPNPTLLVDGRVAGAWTRTHRGRRMEIAVEPFRRLTTFQQRALRDEADRVARTYGAGAILL